MAVNCYRDGTFEKIEQFSDIADGDICYDYLGNFVTDISLNDGEFPRPFSVKDPTYSFEVPPEVRKKVMEKRSCLNENRENITDVEECL